MDGCEKVALNCMIFLTRPSKCFVFDILKKELKKYTEGAGLDVGASSMKNRRLFKTDEYYGLDNNLGSLEKGLKIYNSKNTFGILADMTKLNNLTDGSFNVIVSTNTLYVLPANQRQSVISELCRLTSSQGCLIFELPLDKYIDDYFKIAKFNFKKVEIIYYRNIFSRFYESFFVKNGSLGYHAIASTRPFRFIAWLISRLEYLTCFFPFLNRHILLICVYKKNQEDILSINNKINFSNFSSTGKRLFNLMD